VQVKTQLSNVLLTTRNIGRESEVNQTISI